MSQRACQDFGQDALIADVEAVLATAGVTRVIVDAISSSALTALGFAAKHPERVERLIVQNAFVDGSRWWNNPVRRALVNIAEVDWELCTETWAWLTWGDKHRDRTLGLAAYIRECVDAQQFLRMAAAEASVDYRGRLEGLRMPTLVLSHPRFGRMAPEEHNAEVAGEISDAVLHTIRSTDERVRAIRAFVTGQELEEEKSWPRRPGHSAVTLLSQREQEVLRSMADGLTNKAIAEKLVLSVRTVDAHVRSILAKTGASSRAGAAAFAIRHDLL